ncbi:MAG TPA: hypothetical protein VKK79_03470, partial [Candidatus Lokiarchaeia archaeon]|nr:hypothetical protein [Candidatus Lokiarchaeia archaeon]
MRQKHYALGLIALFIVSLIMGSTFTVSNISNRSENSPAAITPSTSSGIQGFGSQNSLLASQQADAVNIANYLVANATKVGAGVKWTQYYTNSGSLGIVDNLTGYYDGIAGVASFLGKMYEVTKNASYLTTASQAVYWLNQSSGIKDAPGKYKESEGQPRNYTGLEQGAAGVGQMYLDLYQASANQSYLLLAQEVANYLLSISQTVGSGMTWYYKEPVVVTNANNLPDAVNSITAGSITGTLADLAVGGSTYNIGSALIGGTTQAVNYEFYLNLSQWGLYNLIQHIEENKYSYLNLSIRLSSNVGLTSSAVQIGGSDPITYYAMPGGTISTTMQTITQVNTTGIINYIWQRNVGSIIRVKVNATNNAPFTISVDCLNATISYNDTIYNPDYGSGASGIGQFFLNLYAATGNLTYYYTAANVSRYLQYTQIPDAVGIYWGKEKYDNGLDQTLGYTSVADGVAGIGKFLVDLYKANISDSVPLSLATQAANWVTSQSQSSTAPGYISYAGFPNYQDFLGSAMWVHYSNESSTDTRSGYYDGVAGVGDFLLDIASITGGAVGSYYFNNATQIATFLGSVSTGFLGPELLQMSAAFTYNWVDGTTTTQSSNSTRAGGVGDLLFLARCAHLTGSTAIGTTVDGGLRYLLA